jgi:uncharacterized membrane protein YidH (DUF202 family)
MALERTMMSWVRTAVSLIGFGFTIVQFQRSFAIPEMWSGIILLGLLGFALSLVFRLAERRALRWYEGLRAAQRRAG